MQKYDLSALSSGSAKRKTQSPMYDLWFSTWPQFSVFRSRKPSKLEAWTPTDWCLPTKGKHNAIAEPQQPLHVFTNLSPPAAAPPRRVFRSGDGGASTGRAGEGRSAGFLTESLAGVGCIAKSIAVSPFEAHPAQCTHLLSHHI